MVKKKKANTTANPSANLQNEADGHVVLEAKVTKPRKKRSSSSTQPTRKAQKKTAKKTGSIAQEKPTWYYSTIGIAVTTCVVVILFFFGGTLWRFMRGLVVHKFGKDDIAALADTTYDMPDGLDISHYQHDIQWAVLGQHPTVKFVYIKATEGTNHYDKRYERHHKQARNSGLLVGSYHFYHPNKPVGEQVKNFVSHTDFDVDQLRPVIDIEVRKGMSKKAIQDSLRMCLDTLTSILGDKPIVYTSRNFYHEVLDDRFGDYPLWIADYRHGESLPQNCVLWQYTDKGDVVGVHHPVDCNKLIKSFSAIQL